MEAAKPWRLCMTATPTPFALQVLLECYIMVIYNVLKV